MTATAWMAGDGPAGLSWRAWLLVSLLAVAALFPGITAIPVMDRDEGRYLQASKQMMETGDYIDIRLQDEPRYGYPAGTYWAKTASASLFGGADAPAWAYRLPSFVAGVIAVLATAWIGARIGGPVAGVVAGVLVATSLVVAVESRTARSDALLLATVAVAQAGLYRLTRLTDDRPAFWGAPLLFWVAHGVGVLIKGPIITLVLVLTVAALCLWRRDRVLLRRLRILPGLGVVALMVLPWLIAITVKAGPTYIQEAIGSSMMGKVTKGDRAHGAPPGYHLVALFVAFWPGALLAGAATALAWIRRREDDVRFLICWLVPTFLVFELVATKLPHYTMPTYPALAVLSGLVVAGGFRPEGRWRWLHRAVVTLFAVVAFGLAVVPIAAPLYFGAAVSAASVAATALGAAALVAGLLMVRAPSFVGVVRLAVAVALFYAVTFQAAFPRLDVFWPSRELARVVDRLEGCASKPVAITGYAEPSSVFYLGTETGLGGPKDAADLLAGNPGCGIAVTSEPDRAAFLAAASEIDVSVVAVETFDGFNYTRGRPVRLTVYIAEGSSLRAR